MQIFRLCYNEVWRKENYEKTVVPCVSNKSISRMFRFSTIKGKN